MRASPLVAFVALLIRVDADPAGGSGKKASMGAKVLNIADLKEGKALDKFGVNLTEEQKAQIQDQAAKSWTSTANEALPFAAPDSFSQIPGQGSGKKTSQGAPPVKNLKEGLGRLEKFGANLTEEQKEKLREQLSRMWESSAPAGGSEELKTADGIPVNFPADFMQEACSTPPGTDPKKRESGLKATENTLLPGVSFDAREQLIAKLGKNGQVAYPPSAIPHEDQARIFNEETKGDGKNRTGNKSVLFHPTEVGMSGFDCATRRYEAMLKVLKDNDFCKGPLLPAYPGEDMESAGKRAPGHLSLKQLLTGQPGMMNVHVACLIKALNENRYGPWDKTPGFKRWEVKMTKTGSEEYGLSLDGTIQGRIAKVEGISAAAGSAGEKLQVGQVVHAVNGKRGNVKDMKDELEGTAGAPGGVTVEVTTAPPDQWVTQEYVEQFLKLAISFIGVGGSSMRHTPKDRYWPARERPDLQMADQETEKVNGKPFDPMMDDQRPRYSEFIKTAAVIHGVGDIHGNWPDFLKQVFLGGIPGHLNHLEQPYHYVFMGDLVDRGPKQLACLIGAMAYRLAWPQYFYVLAGNHELINHRSHTKYGFVPELHTNFGDLWKHTYARASELFRQMPVAAIAAIGGRRVLFVHAGVGGRQDFVNSRRHFTDANAAGKGKGWKAEGSHEMELKDVTLKKCKDICASYGLPAGKKVKQKAVELKHRCDAVVFDKKKAEVEDATGTCLLVTDGLEKGKESPDHSSFFKSEWLDATLMQEENLREQVHSLVWNDPNDDPLEILQANTGRGGDRPDRLPTDFDRFNMFTFGREFTRAFARAHFHQLKTSFVAIFRGHQVKHGPCIQHASSGEDHSIAVYTTFASSGAHVDKSGADPNASGPDQDLYGKGQRFHSGCRHPGMNSGSYVIIEPVDLPVESGWQDKIPNYSEGAEVKEDKPSSDSVVDDRQTGSPGSLTSPLSTPLTINSNYSEQMLNSLTSSPSPGTVETDLYDLGSPKTPSTSSLSSTIQSTMLPGGVETVPSLWPLLNEEKNLQTRSTYLQTPAFGPNTSLQTQGATDLFDLGTSQLPTLTNFGSVATGAIPSTQFSQTMTPSTNVQTQQGLNTNVQTQQGLNTNVQTQVGTTDLFDLTATRSVGTSQLPTLTNVGSAATGGIASTPPMVSSFLELPEQQAAKRDVRSLKILKDNYDRRYDIPKTYLAKQQPQSTIRVIAVSYPVNEPCPGGKSSCRVTDREASNFVPKFEAVDKNCRKTQIVPGKDWPCDLEPSDAYRAAFSDPVL